MMQNYTERSTANYRIQKALYQKNNYKRNNNLKKGDYNFKL